MPRTGVPDEIQNTLCYERTSDNKRVKDGESLIVQYDDHYADIPLAEINEAETLDDYVLPPVIDHR